MDCCSRSLSMLYLKSIRGLWLLVTCLILLGIFTRSFLGSEDTDESTSEARQRHPETRVHILQYFGNDKTEPDDVIRRFRRPQIDVAQSLSTPPSRNFEARPKFHYTEDLFCLDKDIFPKIVERGSYWVFQNYIPAQRSFHCNETITYTTHADPTFLDNLEPLLERWQGPVSLSVYAPGTDFNKAVKAILYQRECSHSNLVKDFVTFHLFFDHIHLPPSKEKILKTKDILNMTIQCENVTSSVAFPPKESLFKNIHELTYPVNVARNVARESANSYFVFPSDIELYPSPGLIPSFLAMIKRNDPILRSPKPKVFVSPIFEIESGQSLPNNKRDLLKLHSEGIVKPFHASICSHCHKVPKWNEWMKDSNSTKMEVFTVGKRVNEFHHWEPIFIGTHADPLYDERLSWEGQADKMPHGYVMCVQDYEFHVLNNAFLVHKPGVKPRDVARPLKKKQKIRQQTQLIKGRIMPELKRIFGTKKGCSF
ncbi:hypothetical protein TCAL_11158 [Tigriopus californicus]|uniref:Beta-1,4-glucuronyltransferase 1 n=1 Tax=Tigriopus californicus TaxID=6832 RepID=A0A553NC38_TIGCA|nr:beta-1,4-glucuronyltransferase 1-like isoform X2 [Tigriopus californicus]TRY63012.1 hypothetical protein TCAL_11158 [Tigriopus californicus]|eukprot:TCALIF_11158-PA protein Name:"Similar to b3gnt1 N-acetyllactosaminide beta-1,3-N-acetylglucosaminyltransferase (Danio rerio)" AED:0.23 eAED:0.23 QI:195/1/1/1/0.66/0.5/4/292/481